MLPNPLIELTDHKNSNLQTKKKPKQQTNKQKLIHRRTQKQENYNDLASTIQREK